MRRIFAVVIASWASVLSAQPERTVHGNTLVSRRLPAVEITLSPEFRYVGGQIVNLYGNAEAEQHIFVKGPANGPVEAYCWLQFEHFLPTNTYAYDYRPVRTVDLGGLSFTTDTRSYINYQVTTSDTGSDGAAISKLLHQHDVAFPTRVARARMFYLPTADHRTELMIIYGEALADTSTIVTSARSTSLDSVYASAAAALIDRVRRNLTIKSH